VSWLCLWPVLCGGPSSAVLWPPYAGRGPAASGELTRAFVCAAGPMKMTNARDMTSKTRRQFRCGLAASALGRQLPLLLSTVAVWLAVLQLRTMEAEFQNTSTILVG
jgi:hypothetical protein